MNRAIYESIAVILLILFVYLYAKKVAENRSNIALSEKIISDTLKHFETRITKYGDTIQEQKQNIITEKQAKIYYKKELEEAEKLGIKRVQTIVSLTAKIENLKTELKAVDSIVIIKIKDSSDKITYPYLRLPQKYEINKEWYAVGVDIDINGKLIHNLKKLSLEQKITIGYVKEKHSKLGRLFEKAKPKVITTSINNPIVKVSPNYNIVVKKNKSKLRVAGNVSLNMAAFLLGFYFGKN